jgi:hypothetical protein
MMTGFKIAAPRPCGKCRDRGDFCPKCNDGIESGATVAVRVAVVTRLAVKALRATGGHGAGVWADALEATMPALGFAARNGWGDSGGLVEHVRRFQAEAEDQRRAAVKVSRGAGVQAVNRRLMIGSN